MPQSFEPTSRPQKSGFVKRIIIISIILVVLLFGLYSYMKIVALKAPTFIGSDAMIVAEADNLLNLLENLEASDTVNLLKDDREYRSLYAMLIELQSSFVQQNKSFLRLLNTPVHLVVPTHDEPLLILDMGMKSLLFGAGQNILPLLFSNNEQFSVNTYEANGAKLLDLTIKKNNSVVHFHAKKNILLISLSRNSILQALEAYQSGVHWNNNENFQQVRANVAGSTSLRIYYNAAYILNIIQDNSPAETAIDALSFLNIAGIAVNLKKDSITLDGFNSTGLSNSAVNRIFNSQPRTIKVPEILPEDIETLAVFTFDHFEDVYESVKELFCNDPSIERQFKKGERNLRRLLKEPLDTSIFSWLGNEIALAQLPGKSNAVIIIHTGNPGRAQNFLNDFAQRGWISDSNVPRYRNQYDIKKINLPFALNLIASVFIPNLELPYFSIIDDFLLISMDYTVLQKIMDAALTDAVLSLSDEYKTIALNIDRQANVFCYWKNLNRIVSLPTRHGILPSLIRSYPAGMMSIKFINSGMKEKVYLIRNIRTTPEPAAGWPITLNGNAAGEARIADIDGKGLDDIIVAAQNGKVYVLDYYGNNVLGWPIKTDGKITTPPAIGNVDNSAELEIGVVTENGIVSLYSKNGTMMDGWPKNIEETVDTRLCFADITGDRKDDIIVGTTRGNVYAWTADGTPVQGFPVALPGLEGVGRSIVPVNIKSGAANELLVPTITWNGHIYALTGTGTLLNNWPKETKTANKTVPIITPMNPGNQSVILFLTGNGTLYAWNVNGSTILSNITITSRITVNPAAADINNDGITDIVTLNDAGLIKISAPNGTTIKQWQAGPPSRNSQLLITDINDDGKSEIIYAFPNGIVRVWNNEGVELSALQMNGSFTPSIHDFDHDHSREAVTVNRNGTVCVYQLP